MRRLVFAVLLLLPTAACFANDEARALDFMSLYYAAEKGHVVLVEGLLARGTPVNPPKLGPTSAEYLASQFDTPLSAAAEAGHAEVVEILLGRGADPNDQCCSGETALWSAAAGGHTEIVKLLLAADADPRLSGADGSPLDAARAGGHLEIILLLEASLERSD